MQGWFVLITNILFNKTSYKSKRRLVLCRNCQYNSNGICSLCGCVIKAKVRVDYIEDEDGISIDGCPKRKW